MATMQDAHEGHVRTVPPWVADADDADEVDYLLPQPPRRPTDAVPAEHHFLPHPKSNAPKGRKFDHLRERSPVVLGAPIVQNASRWADFAKPAPGKARIRGRLLDSCAEFGLKSIFRRNGTHES